MIKEDESSDISRFISVSSVFSVVQSLFPHSNRSISTRIARRAVDWIVR
jgi:hypothetical protein